MKILPIGACCVSLGQWAGLTPVHRRIKDSKDNKESLRGRSGLNTWIFDTTKIGAI